MRLLVLLVLLVPTSWSTVAAEVDPASVEFFESRIRPALIEHCYECHSEEARASGDLQGGLLVDSAQRLASGGDSGPAVLPGDPDASLLLAAIEYRDFEMPPQGKLDEAIIGDFRQWIAAGATDPRQTPALNSQSPEDLLARGRSHWSYQPLNEPIFIPTPTSSDSPATPIDAFIQHRWRELPHVAPAPLADRATLARRIFFDLTGLPPTPDQLREFIEDDRPDAYVRLVDRLLASPDFGPHWGRHWLDVARFAESVTLRGLVQHEAWRFRDYVVDAFNSDLPYDRFVREQVAGDLLTADSLADRQRQAIATGFLTLGNHNLEDQDKEKLNLDAVDEQLTVIGSAILAQTLGCARCHDHKFDPIPTRDYYALAGILRNVEMFEHANVSRWIENPLPVSAAEASEIEEHEQQLAELQTQIAELESRLNPDTKDSKSVASSALAGIVLDDSTAELVGTWTPSEHSPRFVGSGYLHDGGERQGEKEARFVPREPLEGAYRVRVSYSPGANRATRVVVTVRDAHGVHRNAINQRETPSIAGLFRDLGEFVFTANAPPEVVITNERADGHVIVDSVQFLPISLGVETVLASDVSVNERQGDQSEASQQAVWKEQLEQLKHKREQLAAMAPRRPLYMGVRERDKPQDMAVRIRGNTHRFGEVAPRGVLSVASGQCELAFNEQSSGRVELAEWLTDRSNPLTARVMVNRIWGWLMGEWIVRSPDNFGTTGVPPTHPELLDYLARQLIDNDWSTKQLVREIVLSETYRRDSSITAEMLATDPGNRLWLRANRRRLTAEALLDTMHIVSGKLDRQLGGKSFADDVSADYAHRYEGARRTVYWPAFRNAIPELVQTFDGANPSMVTGRRETSIVAPQSLYLMNSPEVAEYARGVGQMMVASDLLQVQQRVREMYLLVLNREPAAGELQAIEDYLQDQDVNSAATWSEIAQALFGTIDFQFLR